MPSLSVDEYAVIEVAESMLCVLYCFRGEKEGIYRTRRFQEVQWQRVRNCRARVKCMQDRHTRHQERPWWPYPC
jgi:hypothetical protein